MAHVDASRRAMPSVDFESGVHKPAGFIHYRKALVALSLIFGDSVATLLAVSAGAGLVRWVAAMPLQVTSLTVFFVVPLFYMFGLYTGQGLSPFQRFRLRVLGTVILFALTLVAERAAEHKITVYGTAAIIAVCLIIVGHYVEHFTRTLLIRANLWSASAAIVGCRESARHIAEHLMQNPDFGLRIVGIITAPDDDDIHHPDIPAIGALQNINHIRSQVEVMIFTSAAHLADFGFQTYPLNPSSRLLLIDAPLDGERLWSSSGKQIGGAALEVRRDLYRQPYRAFKRAMDLCFSIPIALLALPVIAVLALIVKSVDPGPAFYVQQRIGRNGSTFGMLKLRTMYVNAEARLNDHLHDNPQARAEWERYFKLKNDARILPYLGTFLRRSSLDELPQLWNVIRGDMSLVGPRPFPSYHMKVFDQEFQAIRTSVQPGITGVWQTSSRSEGDLQIQKTEDLFYIKNWSLLLDIYLLLQTVPAVLSAQGAR